MYLFNTFNQSWSKMQQHSSICKDLTSMGVTHTQLNRRMDMGNSLAKLPKSSGRKSRSRAMRISIPTSRFHSLARTALAHECNPDDARALAPVKALEDPPALGPLLQMKALHGFDSACFSHNLRQLIIIDYIYNGCPFMLSYSNSQFLN